MTAIDSRWARHTFSVGIVIQFLALLQSEFTTPLVAFVYDNNYHETFNLSLSLDDVIDTWPGISQIQCGSKCIMDDNYDSFSWRPSDGLCSIGSLVDGTQRDNDSTKLFIGQIKPTCPGHYGYEMRSNGTTARCLHLSSKISNYDDAMSTCSHLGGGRLFKANSKELIDVLSEMVLEKGYGQQRVFIGLNDRQFEDNFVWSDGQQMSAEERSELFRSGQPDNSGDEDCGEVVMYYANTFNDIECSAELMYVCEKVL